MIVKRVLSKLGFTGLRNRLSDFPYVRAIAKDKMKWSKCLYHIMTYLHRKEYEQHKKFTKSPSDPITISLIETGCSNPSNDVMTLIAQSNLEARFNDIDWTGRCVNRYKPWMWYCEPAFDKQLVQLTTQLAKELSGYLYGLPVLQSAYFWKSMPCNGEDMGSQRWHIDNNDHRQIRCVIAINTIDENNGAIEYISVGESKKIYNQFERIDRTNRRNKKRDNEELEQFKPTIIPLYAPKGHAFYLDVGNCYHRGSRNMSKERHVLVFQFMTPFHIDSKLIQREHGYGIDEHFIDSEEEALVFKYYGNNYIRSEKYKKGTNNAKWHDKMKEQA